MHAEFKVQNMSNVIVFTKLFNTVNLHGVVKLTRKITPLDLRPNKENHVLIHSSVPIAKGITGLTLAIISSSNIGLTKSSTPKFEKIGKNQFIQL